MRVISIVVFLPSLAGENSLYSHGTFNGLTELFRIACALGKIAFLPETGAMKPAQPAACY
jgi:hypothetical protein